MDNQTPSDLRTASETPRRITTFTGKLVNPLSMCPDNIDILDIAHHLSLECRYSGACPEHYSVAQHSVYVSCRFHSPTLRLAGLLHDSAEAYLKDIPSPVKRDPRMAWYVEIEHALTRMIFKKFGIDPELLAETKAADDQLLIDEIASFWADSPMRRSATQIITPWSPRQAEDSFLAHFYLYAERLKL